MFHTSASHVHTAVICHILLCASFLPWPCLLSGYTPTVPLSFPPPRPPMGACNSSAALDPVDVTGDGSAPVFWSPEREQEKRAAKLRETQQKQQREIERATGHLKKSAAGRRNTASKSREEEKQQADDSTIKDKETVQPARPSRTSRPASVSFPSPPQPALSEEELSEYPLPKSARRHARATSASLSSMASATRSPEVSVNTGVRSEGEMLSTPRQQQATPMATRRTSNVPEAVKEGEERQTEEEKESEASAPPPLTTAATTSTITPVRVLTVSDTQRQEIGEERVSVSSASAAFGVQLRKVPTVVKVVEVAAVPSESAAITA